jgi:aspartyl-tRNA(Asn)/glutamyl-tRNA(Gln) amidotransferase subunit A
MSGRSAAHGTVARRPRLAVPARWLKGRLALAVRADFEALLADLRGVAELVEVDVPALHEALAHYTSIVRAEAAWIHRETLAAGGDGFSESVLAPMRDGECQHAQVYLSAMRFRDRLVTELDRTLQGVDAMVLPTTAVLPPLRGQTEVEVEGGRMSTREAVLGQTLAFSFAGLPTLSLPTRPIDGLPGSLQVVGPRERDATVLALGRWLEARLGASS